MKVINCTIGDCYWENNEGCALYLGGKDAVLDLYNSVIYRNEPPQILIGNPSTPVGQEPSTLNLWYNDVEGGYGGIYNSFNIHTVNWLEGNTDADPMWEDSGADPYSLKTGSPCIDAGVPMVEPGMPPPYIVHQDSIIFLVTPDYDTVFIPSTDLAGNPRIAYGRIDMGAYEFRDTTVHAGSFPGRMGQPLRVFPNPFTHDVFIGFETRQAGRVSAVIYNLGGLQVRRLFDTRSAAVACSLTWDGRDDTGREVPPGPYLITVELDGRLLGNARLVKKR